MKILTIIIIVLTVISCNKKSCGDRVAIDYDSNPETKKDNSLCHYKTEDIYSKTIKGSAITSPVTWPKIENAEVDYYIEGTIAVRSKLTIEPGVIIKFKFNTGFFIYDQGEVIALGTPTLPIRLLTSDEKNGWSGISIKMDDPTKIDFNYVQMSNVNGASSSYCIGSNYGTGSNSGQVFINNSTIVARISTNNVGGVQCGVRFQSVTQFNNQVSITNTSFHNVVNDICY